MKVRSAGDQVAPLGIEDMKDPRRWPWWHWLRTAVLGHHKGPHSLIVSCCHPGNTLKRRSHFFCLVGSNSVDTSGSQAVLCRPPEAQPLRCSVTRPIVGPIPGQLNENLCTRSPGIWVLSLYTAQFEAAALCSLARSLQPRFLCSLYHPQDLSGPLHLLHCLGQGALASQNPTSPSLFHSFLLCYLIPSYFLTSFLCRVNPPSWSSSINSCPGQVGPTSDVSD